MLNFKSRPETWTTVLTCMSRSPVEKPHLRVGQQGRRRGGGEAARRARALLSEDLHSHVRAAKYKIVSYWPNFTAHCCQEEDEWHTFATYYSRDFWSYLR